MPESPLAYFLTFSCYGQRLHGDIRGTSDRTRNAWDLPPIGRDDRRHDANKSLTKAKVFALDSPSKRMSVHEAIEERASHAGWTLLALNVRTTHVHVVVGASEPPEVVMNSLKARSTRRLRADTLVAAIQPAWARHGSTIYLWNENAIEDACAYVLDGQGGDLPGSIRARDGSERDDEAVVERSGNSAIRSLPVAELTTRSGLCDACRHARFVVSGKGSTFVLCELSKIDARFRKYPSVPVRSCEGYEPLEP